MRMGLTADDRPVIENPNIPVIYADDVLSVEVHGPNVRITFCEYRTECGREVRLPVLTVIRPVESVHGAVLMMMREAIEQTRPAARAN